MKVVRISQKFYRTKDLKIIEIPIEDFPVMKIGFQHNYCIFTENEQPLPHKQIGKLIQDAHVSVSDGNHLISMTVEIVESSI